MTSNSSNINFEGINRASSAIPQSLEEQLTSCMVKVKAKSSQAGKAQFDLIKSLTRQENALETLKNIAKTANKELKDFIENDVIPKLKTDSKMEQAFKEKIESKEKQDPKREIKIDLETPQKKHLTIGEAEVILNDLALILDLSISDKNDKIEKGVAATQSPSNVLKANILDLARYRDYKAEDSETTIQITALIPDKNANIEVTLKNLFKKDDLTCGICYQNEKGGLRFAYYDPEKTGIFGTKTGGVMELDLKDKSFEHIRELFDGHIICAKKERVIDYRSKQDKIPFTDLYNNIEGLDYHKQPTSFDQTVANPGYIPVKLSEFLKLN